MFAITRVSLVPFDLRGSFATATLDSFVDLGLRPMSQSPWVERLLGSRPSVYEADENRFVLISQQGLGLCLRRESRSIESLANHNDIAEILVNRDQHHRSIQDNSHCDTQLFVGLRDRLSNALHRRDLRPDVWPCSPYTLSFFYLPVPAAGVLTGDEERRGLFALLEPSQVRRRDKSGVTDEVDECASLISSLNLRRFNEEYKDCDVKVGSFALCSWAGMVAFDEHAADLAYYETLEIRLQMAWMRATYIRRWAEMALVESSLEADRLSKVASEVTPMMRQARRLIDGTASSRDQRLFDELVRTSDLEREIEGAEQAVADVRDQIEVARSRVRRRYDLTVESLLLLLATLQVVPLVTEVPIARLDSIWLAGGAAVLGLFAAFRINRSR